MELKKISQLTELTTAATSDVFPILDISAAETKKIKKSNITENNFTTTLKNKLNGVQTGADVTSSHTAAGISGQGDLATQNRSALSYTDGADVTGSNTAADTTLVAETSAATVRDQAAAALVATNNLSDISAADTAFTNIKQPASASATGVVELATNAETVTGTDTGRVVTPANLTAKMAAPGAIGGTTPDIGAFTNLEFFERSADPADPAEGKVIFWMSDGTGTGDDGDILFKITAGSVTKTGTLIDFSAI